ncbi:hypothetical protein [Paenibacillus sp.]|uniref:hypothetical protein n=1 Tax=Paenibacillus sp. TaxID=58172 RepID=UPI002D5B373A|nr:hypothetical protein [Paenibacillus sp.]HZG55628.1 hypothetical protein [Paenibacillus sp.]
MYKNFLILLIAITLSACGSKTEAIQEHFNKLTLNDVLTALNDSGIQNVERTKSQHVYDIQRESAEQHLYKLEPGKLTVYVFSNVVQRREVQRDPFPAAEATPPNGSYGMGNILVFYYDGDNIMAQKLLRAFEPLGVEGELN